MQKNRTQDIYSHRIQQALEFISHHIDETIQLDDIANASHFSPYHFHRIFHALVGETVNDYVSRKRMERAAYRLLSRENFSITEVAEAGGFSSSANFSKAFKLYFGISPSELRNPHSQSNENENSKIGKLYRKYGKEFNPQDLYSQFVTQLTVFEHDKLEEMLMNIKVEDMQQKSIACLSSPGGYALESIYATWDKLIDWGRSNGIAEASQTKFALCYDNPAITPEDKCRYDAAIEILPDMKVSLPYVQSVIPSGQYAVAYYKGDADKINNFMTEFCSHWLCNSGYEPDDYPPVFNYLNDSREDDFVEMNVYIKLKTLDVN